LSLSIRTLVVWLVLATRVPVPVPAAFETTRSLDGFSMYDPLSPHHRTQHANPATLTLMPSYVFASAARPFGLHALDSRLAGIVVGNDRLAGAASLSALGQNQLYREMDASISVAVSLLGRAHLGAAFHHLDVQLGDRFSPVRGQVWDAGIWLTLSPQLGAGLSVTDAGAPYVVGRPLLRARMRFSASYLHSDRLSLQVGAQKWMDEWSFALGQTIGFASHLYLSAELQTEPLLLRLSARVVLGRLNLSYTYRDHPDLGGDQMVGVAFRISPRRGDAPQ